MDCLAGAQTHQTAHIVGGVDRLRFSKVFVYQALHARHKGCGVNHAHTAHELHSFHRQGTHLLLVSELQQVAAYLTRILL